MGISNYIKVALRSLFRFRSDAIFNVLGLSVGITICIFVLLYVRAELNYDRHFTGYKHIYRVVTEGVIGDNYFENALTPMPALDFLRENFSEVEVGVKVVRGSNKLVTCDDKKFNEDNFYYADSSFFNVFDISLVEGEKEEVLRSSESVVISSKIAKKYFGNEDPLGKKMTIDNGLVFYVSGIYKPMPENTHFHCDFIASLQSVDKLYKAQYAEEFLKMKHNWFQLNRYTYVVLKKGVDVDALTLRMQTKVQNVIDTQINEFASNIAGQKGSIETLNLRFQPVKDIHLYSGLDNELEPNSKKMYVVLFLTVAVFVLLITCINFMNLTTARISNRLQEVGVRKIAGFNRRELFVQFVVEALTYSFLALFLGLVLVELLLPGFNALFGLHLKLNRLESHADLFYVAILTIFVGLFSGLYPALSFSGLREVEIFKNGLFFGKKGFVFRGLLAASQVLVATFLVVLTVGMYWQIQFLKTKDLGFSSKDVLVVERGYALGKKFPMVKNRLKSIPGVVEVSACLTLPGENASSQSFNISGKDGDKAVLLPYNYVEKDFFKTLGVNFVAGNIWGRTPLKMSHDIVINNAAKEMMGMAKPLGQRLRYSGAEGEDYGFSIVGVTKNFHFEPVQLPIRPLVLMDLPKGIFYDNLLIKMSDKWDANDLIQNIEVVWRDYTDNEPFEYAMLTDVLDHNLDEERMVMRMFLVFSILSLFVAWLGIRAFATYVGDLKHADFQTRKVLGASSHQIFSELFIEIGQYLMSGIVISMPLTFVVLQFWLNGFAYYNRLPVLIMLAICAVIFGLAFLLILIHSARIVKASPVSELK